MIKGYARKRPVIKKDSKPAKNTKLKTLKSEDHDAGIELLREELEDLFYLVASSGTRDRHIGKRRAKIVSSLITISESIGTLSDGGREIFEELIADLEKETGNFFIHSKKGFMYYQIRELERIVENVGNNFLEQALHHIVLPKDEGSPDVEIVLTTVKKDAYKISVDAHFAAEGIIDERLSKSLQAFNKYFKNNFNTEANPHGYNTNYNFFRNDIKES